MSETHTLLSAALGKLHCGVLIIDSQRRICFINQWLLQALRHPALDYQDRPLLDVLPEIADSRLYKSIGQALDKGLPAVLSPSLNPYPLPLFNGRGLGLTGVKNGGNDTNAPPFRASLVFSQNATVVASAGNDGRDLDQDSGRVCDTDGTCTTVNLRSFPGQLPGVITVSALGPLAWLKNPNGTDFDIRASYSNYGQSAIHFGAPGGNYDGKA